MGPVGFCVSKGLIMYAFYLFSFLVFVFREDGFKLVMARDVYKIVLS